MQKSHSDSVAAEPPAAWKLPGEQAVVWTLWLTYGAFYFCRTNLSVAVPGMKAPIAEGGLGLDGTQVGWILASLKIAYGLGQLVNGQLSERVSPRVMLALGMFGSAGLNVLFGFGAGFYFLLFVWAANGFCQSLGWTPTVRVVANWVPIIRRGNAIGIIGTGYQITLGLTYLVAGQAAEHLGWRGALWIPAGLLAAAGAFMLVVLREAPVQQATRAIEPSHQPASRPTTTLSESLYWTLYNPTLWIMGLTLGLLNACRYGFLDWGVTHLMEAGDLPVGKAAIQFFVIAIGATAGAYLAGWATDRFFGSRRAPVICILMAALGALSIAYDHVAGESPAGTIGLLVIIGFCIFGPQVLLVGTAPADLAHRGTSAAAAGFVNFMGYMGAATGDVITGYYSAPEHGGWHAVIYIWGAWAFAGAVLTAALWNTTPQRIGVVPAAVPKLVSIGTLVTAAIAIGYHDQLLALQVATWGAAVVMLAALANRWAAAPGLLIAAAGVLTVFVNYVQMGQAVTWAQVVAMVAFGLTMITSTMVLVEQEGEACELS